MFVAADGSVIMFVDSAVVVESVLLGNVSRNAVRERVLGGVHGNVIVDKKMINNKNKEEFFLLLRNQCKLVQLDSHAIAEETTEARVKDYSKVHKRMTRQKGAKIAATKGKFWTGAKIQ